jgi:hypothetical protein
LYYWLLGPNPLNLHTKQDEAKKIFLRLMEGYTQENYISKDQIELIDYFFKMRDYILLSVIYEHERFREWEKQFIEGASERLINDKKFVDVDFKSIY